MLHFLWYYCNLCKVITLVNNVLSSAVLCPLLVIRKEESFVLVMCQWQGRDWFCELEDWWKESSQNPVIVVCDWERQARWLCEWILIWENQKGAEEPH